MPELSSIIGVIGIVTFIGGAIAVVTTRSVSSERIDHLEGLVDSYKNDIERERQACDRQISELKTEHEHQRERITHLKGQLDAVTGDLGKRIGQAVAKEVIERVVAQMGEQP